MPLNIDLTAADVRMMRDGTDSDLRAAVLTILRHVAHGRRLGEHARRCLSYALAVKAADDLATPTRHHEVF